MTDAEKVAKYELALKVIANVPMHPSDVQRATCVRVATEALKDANR